MDLLSKAPEGENQPSTEVDLFISTEKIMVLNTDLKEIMMDHGLRTISYIADIGELVVIMARRRVLPQVQNKYFTILDWKTNNWLKVLNFLENRTDNNTNFKAGEEETVIGTTPKMICHVFESEEVDICFNIYLPCSSLPNPPKTFF